MNKHIFISAFVSAAVAFLIAYAMTPKTTVATAQKPVESVLERIKRTGTLRCGYTPWAPFWEVDPNTNQAKGITKDLSDRFFELAGWKPEYVEVVPGNEVQDLRSGRVDMNCGGGPWYIGSIREVNYTHPYYYAGVWVWGRDDETRFADMEAMNNPAARFVGLDGDISLDLVQRLFPKASIQTLSGMIDPAQLMLNVSTRKADLVIIDKVSALNYNKTNDVKLKMLFPDQPIAVYGGGFAVAKGDPELLETMNGLIDMMNNMNLPEQLIKKYDLSPLGLMPPAKLYQK